MSWVYTPELLRICGKNGILGILILTLRSSGWNSVSGSHGLIKGLVYLMVLGISGKFMIYEFGFFSRMVGSHHTPRKLADSMNG